MSIDESIECFVKLQSHIFSNKSIFPLDMMGKLRPRYITRSLDEAIEKVLYGRGYDEETPLREGMEATATYVKIRNCSECQIR